LKIKLVFKLTLLIPKCLIKRKNRLKRDEAWTRFFPITIKNVN